MCTARRRVKFSLVTILILARKGLIKNTKVIKQNGIQILEFKTKYRALTDRNTNKRHYKFNRSESI